MRAVPVPDGADVTAVLPEAEPPDGNGKNGARSLIPVWNLMPAPGPMTGARSVVFLAHSGLPTPLTGGNRIWEALRMLQVFTVSTILTIDLVVLAALIIAWTHPCCPA